MSMCISELDRSRVEAAQSLSRASGTIVAYRKSWSQFTQWLSGRGSELGFPVHADLVALYAIHLANDRGYVYGSVLNALSAIAYMHRRKGYRSPTEVASVREVIAGLRRTLGTGSSQARPLFSCDIEEIVRSACLPRPSRHMTMAENGYEKLPVAERRGLLDIAIVRVMADGLLRASEAMELRWQDVGQNQDGSGTLHIRFSKGDQVGNSVFLWISPMAMSSLDALRAYGNDSERRVFGIRSLSALTGRIERAADAAVIGRGYSGHSPRVGRIYELVAADISPTLIIQAARWANPKELRWYTRHQEVTNGAVARFYSREREMKEVRIYRPPVVVR